MNFFNKVLLQGCVLVAFLGLLACGDDDSSSSSEEVIPEADYVVESIEDVVKCTSKRAGATAYVEDEKLIYICHDKEWVVDSTSDLDSLIENSKKDSSNADGKSCSSKKEKSSSSNVAAVNSSSSTNSNSRTFIDLRDSNIYKYVVIGDQVWMAENLRYVYEINGSAYGNEENSSSMDYDFALLQMRHLEIPSGGRVYTWAATIDTAGQFEKKGKGCGLGKPCYLSGRVRGICPEGWHLPSDDEWNVLHVNTGDDLSSLSNLKNSFGYGQLTAYDQVFGDIHVIDQNGTNAFGFSMVKPTIYWRVSEADWDYAYTWQFNSYKDDVGVLINKKDNMYPIRCISDNEPYQFVKTENVLRVCPSSVKKGEMKDKRDGHKYKTVIIGTQKWMAENLNFDSGEGTYCYNDVEAFCDTLGRYYTNEAAQNSCPDGWHLPSLDDWNVLFDAVGGIDYAGTALKENWKHCTKMKSLYEVMKGYPGAIYSCNYNTGDDAYGFNLLPAGYKMGNEYYNHDSYSEDSDPLAIFWTSTTNKRDTKNFLWFRYNNRITVDTVSTKISNAFSVRCVSDEVFEVKKGSYPCATISSSSAPLSSSSTLLPHGVSPSIDPSTVVYGQMKDSRDGQVYKTVKIGDQTWMAENLNYVYHIASANSFCYNGEPDSCAKYGRLYTWAAAVDSISFAHNEANPIDVGSKPHSLNGYQGICPDGWHLPTKEEWDILIVAIGKEKNTAWKLRAENGWIDTKDSTDEYDVYGFSALPSGFYSNKDGFVKAGFETAFWSMNRKSMILSSDDRNIKNEYSADFFGLPIRCVEGKAKDLPIVSLVDPSTVKVGKMTDNRDGHTYKTVTIGPQTWMAENLNFAYNVPLKKKDSSSFCYKDSPDSCSKYGRLYTWSAAMDSAGVFSETGLLCGDGPKCHPEGKIRGVCPEGWHLPSADEWDRLFISVNGYGWAGTLLKTTTGWLSANGENGNGTDTFNFSVLPAGYNKYNSIYSNDFNSIGSNAYFWDSEEPSRNSYSYVTFSHNLNKAYFSTLSGFGEAYSVRCILGDADGKTIFTSRKITVEKEGEMTDNRDGKTYKTVRIGNRVWMAENLNFAYNVPTKDEDSSSFCYDNNPDFCDKYGRLYLWSAAMDSAAEFSDKTKGCGNGKKCTPETTIRGVCPEGWHLPNSYDLENLLFYAGGEKSGAKRLFGCDDPLTCPESIGFDALPAGVRYAVDDYSNVTANFWTSNELSDGTTLGCTLNYSLGVDVISKYKKYAYSVRCLKDFDD